MDEILWNGTVSMATQPVNTVRLNFIAYIKASYDSRNSLGDLKRESVCVCVYIHAFMPQVDVKGQL